MMQREGRNYKAVVFDLDGTLLDTLDDLTNSVNAVLEKYGIAAYSREDVRSFVGNGIRRLLQLTVPGAEQHPQFEQIVTEFKEHYGIHCMDETEPYPGVMALLDWLQREGYLVAIVSNKADFAVKKLRDVYFRDLVPVAIGEKEGCRKKPAPDSVWAALKELGCEPAEAVYVGDSDVDLLTAQNADMPCIAVSWGFRSREFLVEHGAVPEWIAANVNELKALLINE